MQSPRIHPQGYWLSDEEGHEFDRVLAHELGLFMRGKSVCDFGCGTGKYVHWLRRSGLECDGYDGNPNTYELSLGACHTLNLAEPFHLAQRYDAVICLEVAEHVPKQYETIFLDNLARHAKEMIVLSWAVPGQKGDGHVNCHTNSYAICKLWQRGFRFQPTATLSLRAHCSLPWFASTLMVFSKTRAPRSSSELRAAARIFLQGLKRLDKSNSSAIGASIGKLSRTYLQSRAKLEMVINVLRMLRYDASNLLRPSIVSDRMQKPGLFFPICFTCARHFELLRVALKSLGNWALPIKEINIYVDKTDSFSSAQCELLRSESRYPIAFEQTLHPMAWAGPRVVLNELHAFRKLVAQMQAGDFLVKFDSDVLFLSSAIFKFVTNSKSEAIGTAIWQLYPLSKDDYIQGGCYFIVAERLGAMVSSPITRTALALLREHSMLFEDQLMTALLRQCGARIIYDAFLYSDTILAKPDLDDAELEDRLRAIPSTASVLHFAGNKSNIWRTVERLLPTLSRVFTG
jgi:hypothetical protein